MTNYWIYLIIAGALVVAGLAFYAGMLLRQLKLQREKQAEAELTHIQKLQQHDKKVLDSVVIIVRAMKEEQCDLSEGCWRLSVLLDSLKTSSELSLQFPSIFALYNAIKHMPILEERKKLKKKERMKLDLERMKQESQLATAIHQDLEQLHQYANERIGVLTQP